MTAAQHQGTELQYLPYPLQSRPYIPYQPTQQPLNPQLPRNSNQFNRTDPFIHVSSIVVPGIQGRFLTNAGGKLHCQIFKTGASFIAGY